jgi:Zn-dependent metalloprotease
MKKQTVILLTITLVVFVALVPAKSQSQAPDALAQLQQDSGGQVEITWNQQTGRPSFIRGPVPVDSLGVQSQAGATDISLAFVEQYADLFGVQDAGQELILVSQETDNLGLTHVTWQQVYQGVPVYNARFKTHQSADAQTIIAASNSFFPDVTLVTIQASLSADEALAVAQQALPRGQLVAEPKLVVYPDAGNTPVGDPHLVWLVELRDDNLPARNIYVVDANSGLILETLGRLYTQSSHLQVQTLVTEANLFDQRLISPADIQTFLEKYNSPLSQYTITLPSNIQASAAQVIVMAAAREDWHINPQLLLTYLEWRWELITSSTISPLQVDEIVVITPDVPADFANQLMWLANELWQSYLNYQDQLDIAPTMAMQDILTLSSSGANTLSDFDKVFVTLFDHSLAQDPVSIPRVTDWQPSFRKPFDGRYDINSYFDHGPANDGRTTRFDNQVLTGTVSFCSLGYSCYDGHPAIDYATPSGTPLIAVAAGTILQADNVGDTCGLIHVRIRHDNGLDTHYLHLSSIGVNPATGRQWATNDRIEENAVIGRSGNSGCNTNGPHLHFEVIDLNGSRSVDPYGWWGGDTPEKLGSLFNSDLNVSETDIGFERFYRENWTTDNIGQGNNSLYTNTSTSEQYQNMALWWADIPTDGTYGLKTFIPANATAIGSTYHILHQDGVSNVVKDQVTYAGRWMPLGIFDFYSRQRAAVLLTDFTTGANNERLYFDALTWQLLGRNRQTYDAGNKTSLPGTLVRSESDGPTGDSDVDAAHNFAGDTYDYYWNTHGRDSYDGQGAALLSTANYGVAYQNAFWNGEQMVYGDDFAVKDVVAHELTHAVTEHSANLEYNWQSGALNESISDIFGAMVDRDDWLMGEDLPSSALGGRAAIRDLADPTQFNQPAHTDDWVATCSDNEGVHTNSGITNKAYYNIATAIGKDKAELIFYRALTVYLDATSTLEDARAAALSSATDLYGSSSTTYSGVEAGFNAVGLDGRWSPNANDCTCAASTALLDKTVYADPMSALEVAATLYRVRDELLTGPTGDHYRSLYEQYTGRISQLLLLNAGLRATGGQILKEVSPGLEGMMAGAGDDIVTRENVDDVVVYLTDLAAEDRSTGDGELADTIETEMARIEWDELVGQTYDDAWIYIQSRTGLTSIYLPLILK